MRPFSVLLVVHRFARHAFLRLGICPVSAWALYKDLGFCYCLIRCGDSPYLSMLTEGPENVPYRWRLMADMRHLDKDKVDINYGKKM